MRLLVTPPGPGNTALGFNALETNTTGQNLTAIGYGANVASDSLSNATAIGANAVVGKSNAVVSGGTGANAINVGVGNPSPDSSAVLDLTSTSQGFLPPRMNSAQQAAIHAPAEGLILYNTDVHCLELYDQGAWQTIYCNCPNLTSGDSIFGPANQCPGNHVTYTVKPTPGVSTYLWSTTPAISFTGQGTPSISLTVPATSSLGAYSQYRRGGNPFKLMWNKFGNCWYHHYGV